MLHKQATGTNSIKQHVQCILSFPASQVLDYSQYANTEGRDLVMCNVCVISEGRHMGWGGGGEGTVSDHNSLWLCQSSVSGFLNVE